MSKQQQTIGIDRDLLRKAVQDELDSRREEIGSVQIAEIQFHDGAWCASIREGDGNDAADYSETFAEIEETMIDKYGVNVILRPAAN